MTAIGLGSSKMSFRKVPGGSFDRVDTPQGTRFRVRLTKPVFWQVTPVTVEMYRQYLDSCALDFNPRIEVWDGTWRLGPTFSEANSYGGDRPVVGVSHNDVLGFIAWSQQQDGRRYRLPTEVEFEYASRAGCRCTTSCRWTSISPRPDRPDDAPPAHCPWPVAAGQPNALGLHDLKGLIWQWCDDWYAPYDETISVDPRGPGEPPTETLWHGQSMPPGRVIRGGSFSYGAHYADCSHRHFSSPTDRNFNLGFRIVFNAHPD